MCRDILERWKSSNIYQPYRKNILLWPIGNATETYIFSKRLQGVWAKHSGKMFPITFPAVLKKTFCSHILGTKGKRLFKTFTNLFFQTFDFDQLETSLKCTLKTLIKRCEKNAGTKRFLYVSRPSCIKRFVVTYCKRY